MSHNGRRPPPGPGLRPDPGQNLLSDRRHVSSGCHGYGSSSSGDVSPRDGTLNLLSSCGLDPTDLALLAELPEDVLTVESLPHVLRQLKGQRCPAQACPPDVSASSSSYPYNCTWRPPGSPAPRDPQKPFTVPEPNQGGSFQSPSYALNQRCGPESRDRNHAGPGSALEGRKRTRTPGAPELGYRPAPPPKVYQHQSHERCLQGAPSSSQVKSGSATPSSKEALDFHGTAPPTFPYSCALCDITVMSERVWAAHVKTSHHADGQLRLLQRFPNWDCRMEPASRVDNQSQPWAELRQARAANHSSATLTNQKTKKKAAERSKVVCVKFPAASVDESYLRKLTEPFGKIVKILMFSSLAFVELGSVEQAKDLVKLYENQPVTVNGQQVEFKMSHTFSFLQSSLVVSFSPAPSGEDGRSDLLSIVRRFGLPLYTLFLPSKAFVEMKESLEAQKLVHYYSSNTLRINDDLIKVSFSGEYKTLMRVTSAKRYQEESSSLKRSLSGEEDRTEEAKRGRGHTSTRSSSSKKSAKDRTARSRSRERSTNETQLASGDKSSKDGGSASRAREVLPEERSSSRLSPSRTRSKAREKSPVTSRREEGDGDRLRSRETSCRDGTASSVSTEEHRKEETRTRTTESKPRSAENQRSGDPPRSPSREARSQPEPEPEPESDLGSCDEFQSAESDIEGMEVIGEDGQSLEDEDEEEEEGGAETTVLSEDPEKDQRDEKTGYQEEFLEEEKTETQLEEDKKDVCVALDDRDEKPPDRRTSQGSAEAMFEDVGDPPQTNTSPDSQNRSAETESGPGLVQEPSASQAREQPSPVVEDSAGKSATQRDQPVTDTLAREAAGMDGEQEQQPEPAGGATEPQTPNKPIGVEFVRPVVGYFCNLCQQIYADEDEAKVVHCSTSAHYRRYQEKTGKDPRTSWT